MNLENFLTKQNIKFNNIEQYNVAFTHTSFVHEQKEEVESYERLEFLGDAILGKIISGYLFNEMDMDPGDMTLLRSNIVNKKFLSMVGRELSLNEYMRLGKGENKDTLSDSVYEDVYESLIGAIYLDAGYEQTKEFIYQTIIPKINDIDLDDLKDYKTKLQELLQAEKGKSVTYKTINQERIDNVLHFEAVAEFDDQVLGTGKGLSKKSAEKEAAKDAYKRVAK